MCGLCQLQPIFGDPLQGPSPTDAVKKRAARVKRLIRIHERYVDDCEDTAARLKTLRQEQYELAKEL